MTRKYNILKHLKQLPHEEYKIAKNKLPLALNVSKRTFERWMYLTQDQSLEVPADKLAVIAKFFNVKIEEMFNYEIPQINTKHLKKLGNEKIANELNLTRWWKNKK